MTFADLSPRLQRWLTLGCIGGGVLLVSWAIAASFSGSASQAQRQEINEAILTDADTRQTTIDRLAAQLDLARDRNAELARKLDTLAERQQALPDDLAERLRRSIEREAGAKDQALERRLHDLEGEIARLRQEKLEQTDAPAPASGAELSPEESNIESAAVVAATDNQIRFPQANVDTDPADPTSIFRASSPAKTTGDRPDGAPAGDASSEAAPGQALTIRFVSKRDAQGKVDGETAAEPDNENIFKLPATSILTGTLITGLDAPTGAQAQGEPLPVLLRLKKEAILPNRYRADVRECFALLGAYGDLSSERAHMRGETMSCILHDGTILEQPLKAFAVGEDGREGARGRLVRREGTFIARALLVGFLEAAANALDDNQIVQIGSGGGLDVQGAQAAATSIGASTAGSALGRVADWYIDQAFQLFPVIEIDAGREIDVVLTSTFEMNLPKEDD
jgi:conjugal transfer pilus assembly protein TraB